MRRLGVLLRGADINAAALHDMSFTVARSTLPTATFRIELPGICSWPPPTLATVQSHAQKLLYRAHNGGSRCSVTM